MRYFLRFIELEEAFDKHGFEKKVKIRLANPGRPVSATWSRKDGTTGTISFDYIVDASGRNGIISTKYLKNRRLNEALKNIANWTYWKGAKRFSPGEKNENSPFFEALSDGSGWKKETGLSGAEFYKEYLKMAPQIYDMVQGAEMTSDIKQASDWSYSAGAYAGPHFRLAGDAGCFIDPYFSSGVHLALTSGLSAAATIQASIKGQCNVENKSIQKKAAEGVEFALETMKADKKTSEQAILEKVQGARDRVEEMEKLNEEELATLGAMVQRNLKMTANAQSLNAIANDVIDGLSIDLVRGNLGLVKRTSEEATVTGKASLMTSEQMDALELNRTITVDAS
ncbi:hypothetical protein KVR01_011924 [Diaporthe batatas]|uniref:uncharacterized protein n=1 Tax=Diaporthe batatas TaxID=748121 RepID=UPI001D046C3E|nr:uncharacterized protein KVR01_011924 [Diaporthe batatas]KAG8158163.1 hypothetical protein KVR01_011924 [Diaporthe batatas]